jgi:hypothetical protein
MNSQTLSSIKLGEYLFNFDVSPTHYTIEKAFLFNVDTCLGQNHPLVSFENGSERKLSLVVILDEDLNEKISLADVDTLLKEIEKVEEKKRSIREAELTIGPMKFNGFVTSYRYTPLRFKSNMSPSSARLELSLISTGDLNATLSK